MKDEPISIPILRYIAIDAHKHYVMVGGMNVLQEMVLPTRRVDTILRLQHRTTGVLLVQAAYMMPG